MLNLVDNINIGTERGFFRACSVARGLEGIEGDKSSPIQFWIGGDLIPFNPLKPLVIEHGLKWKANLSGHLSVWSLYNILMIAIEFKRTLQDVETTN
jgi:hypothetical protein